jgi:hypothetical protein
MARARNIKPGFFRNADLVELPIETRLLFIGLWTLADREGRLEDRPKQIKMEIYPSDSFDVGSMLDQLHAAGFINRYEVGASRFIEVQNFIKHQDPHYKEKASEIPPPTGKENFIKATGVTRTQRQRILDRDGHACTSCGATDALCMDHILPISRGGDSSYDNLQVLCSACNTKKSNKIDGEEKNSRQRRVNVGANSIHRNDASPSESGSLIPESGSLIPESGSLIPDSLIPDCLTRETAPRKRGTPPVAKPIDVDQQTWEDWTALRIKKRATVSQTVIDESRLECAKAGISLDRFLKIWCMRGSQGLQADWLKPKEINASSGETTYQRSMRERVMEFSPSIARQAPGVYPLKNMILEDENVTTIAGH